MLKKVCLKPTSVFITPYHNLPLVIDSVIFPACANPRPKVL